MIKRNCFCPMWVILMLVCVFESVVGNASDNVDYVVDNYSLEINGADLFPTSDSLSADVNVVGYFCKNDSLEYWINESEWRVNGSDTVQTAGINILVRIVVTDSLPTGYKMNYTFLDVEADSIDSGLGNFQNRIADMLGKRIVGTTIEFETDEWGSITKFNNLGFIEKQANKLFKQCIDELMKQSEIKALKEMGMDMKSMLKNVPTEQLVEGYIEELKLLFMCHELQYEVGERTIHEDATDSQYESDTFVSVSTDDDGTYHISTDVVNIIPREDIKELVGTLVDNMNDKSVAENFKGNFDDQVTGSGIYESYIATDYLADGWPYKVVKQRIIRLADRSRISQKTIYLQSYR